MNVLQAITSRHSIRGFQDQPVPEATIKTLLNAGRWAPSAGNLQPWFFYVVQDANTRQQLAQAANGQRFVGTAPVDIVICAEPQVSASKYGSRGTELYCLQDTAAAVQNIMLAATAEGLGSCWVGSFDEEQVRQTLEMPKGRRPVAIIALGYSAAEPRGTKRKDLAEISHWV